MSGHAGPAALVGLILLLMLAFASNVAGHPESDAPSLDPRVERAWHEPEAVEPGMQWHGFLLLRDGHNVTGASYQICNAGKSATCFAPPTAAHWLDERTLSFDTNAYLANGKPVDWEAGWLIGVRWCLAEGAAQDASTVGDCAWLPPQTGESIESHYLTFAMPAKAEGAAGASLLYVIAALLVVLAARGRR